MATARLDIRLDEEIKAKAEKASALLGLKSLTEYVVRLMDEDSTQVITARDQRLRNLRESRQYANNNLAGATWEQSLAQEMTVTAQEADTQVSSIDRQIEQLQKDLERR